MSNNTYTEKDFAIFKKNFNRLWKAAEITSEEDLAEKARLSRASVQRAKKSVPTMNILRGLAAAFGVTVSELFEDPKSLQTLNSLFEKEELTQQYALLENFCSFAMLKDVSLVGITNDKIEFTVSSEANDLTTYLQKVMVKVTTDKVLEELHKEKQYDNFKCIAYLLKKFKVVKLSTTNNIISVTFSSYTLVEFFKSIQPFAEKDVAVIREKIISISKVFTVYQGIPYHWDNVSDRLAFNNALYKGYLCAENVSQKVISECLPIVFDEEFGEILDGTQNKKCKFKSNSTVYPFNEDALQESYRMHDKCRIALL